MHNRSRAWLWSAAAISFIMGITLVLNDNRGAGLFLITNGASLQAELSYRQREKAIPVWGETIPLNQNIEGSHHKS